MVIFEILANFHRPAIVKDKFNKKKVLIGDNTYGADMENQLFDRDFIIKKR